MCPCPQAATVWEKWIAKQAITIAYNKCHDGICLGMPGFMKLRNELTIGGRKGGGDSD